MEKEEIFYPSLENEPKTLTENHQFIISNMKVKAIEIQPEDFFK